MRDDSSRVREASVTRGQTTLDFAIGISIFLLTVMFVFTFVPATLQPFTQTAQEETAGANRVGDLLVKDVVSKPGQPYLLDGRCTAALLNDDPGPGCGFDGAGLTARLDLPDHRSINVTMRGSVDGGESGLLCWDGKNSSVAAGTSCAAGDVALAAGSVPPESSDSVVTARRIAAIDGTTATVEVRMW